MEKVAIINNLYFEQRKTLTEIAEIINTSISYISKILRKNEMYKIEKEKRKKENLEQRRKVQKELIYKGRKTKIDIDYINLKNKHVDLLKEDMKCKFKEAESTFQDAPEKERDFLRLFSIICMLSFDVYVKKLLIEKLVDSFGAAAGEGNKEGRKQKGDKQPKSDI